MRVIFLLLLICMGCGQAPKSESQLRLNLCSGIESLDPRRITYGSGVSVLYTFFEGLTRLDERGEAVLGAAKSVTISKDKMRYLFVLKESHWSDGTPVVARDFVYGWRKVLDRKLALVPSNSFFLLKNARAISKGELPLEQLGVFALDDRSLLVELEHPSPNFLPNLALSSFFPVQEGIDEKHPGWTSDFGGTYVCNGPFVPSQFRSEYELLALKNPHYWDKKHVYLDSIHFSMIKDPETALYLFEQGKLDWIGTPLTPISVDSVPYLEGQLEAPVCWGINFYMLNTDVPPLGNQKIRQALALAINREQISQHVLHGMEPKALAYLTPTIIHTQLFQDAATDQATTLFEEGMREEGLEHFPPLTLCYNNRETHEKVAQAVQEQWKKVLGIDIFLEKREWKSYLFKLRSRDYHIARMGWGNIGDPLDFLQLFEHRNNPHVGGLNGTGWEDPCYQQLLQEIRLSTDIARYYELVEEAHNLLIDQMPIIPLTYMSQCSMKQQNVEGIMLTPFFVVDFKSARFVR